MTAREFIIEYLRHNLEGSSKDIAAASEGAHTLLAIQPALSRLKKDGYVECTGRYLKIYRLSEPARLPRGAVKDFITANPGMTAHEIASALNCKLQQVRGYADSASRDGVIDRVKNSNGEFTYTFKMERSEVYGNANPLRAMFEDLLKKARYKENPCN